MILTLAEQNELLDSMLVKNGTIDQIRRGIRNRTICMMILETGLRIGELLKLTRKDIYHNKLPFSTIIIREKVSKNGQTREIPISSRLSEALCDYARYCPSLPDENDPCFYTIRKGVSSNLSVRQVERDIRTAGFRSLHRTVNPFMLRYTFAFNSCKIFMSFDLQRILGLSRNSCIERYYRLREP